MGVVRCKPITAPIWVRIAIALVLACASTFVALWVTSGGLDPQNKGTLLAAILVVPLAFAAKLDWPSGASIALAGVTYFLFWMGAVWWVMHPKTMDSA
ncbi:hypothetical protein [Acidovorax sp. SUPP2539]|uniref:hypothetical protein n=1 Tax=Acidovorax sp. SUPP2539 TaxID=2920878 RepID=UPI0023DE30C0|nr:hypothetical protein [Acidovorax sp. SUPP2539]GKS91509.1 hypothetical protein AVTE2539_19110 [Acidovorax sp. SUPP2539]